MYCSNCGKEVKNPGSFCAYCGAPQTQNPPSLGSNIAPIIQTAANSQPFAGADAGSAAGGIAPSSAAAAAAGTSATVTTIALSTKIILCAVAAVFVIGFGLAVVLQDDFLYDLFENLENGTQYGTFADDETPTTNDGDSYIYNAHEQPQYEEDSSPSRAEIAEAFLQVLHSYGRPIFTRLDNIAEGVTRRLLGRLGRCV